jgi:hypothetical protein
MDEIREVHNKGFYEIVREDSKYNKYIKWFTRCYMEDMTQISSFGYKTRREAEAEVSRMIFRGKEGFPIGNMMSYTEYTCIGSI